MPEQDTEITLGTGRMLAVFFALAAVCALFFGMGYSMGRSSVKPDAPSPEQTALGVASGGARPSASKSNPAPATNAGDPSVAKPPAPNGGQPSASEAPAQETAPAGGSAPPDPMSVANTSSYYVQVAAVSKQEDAEALVSALKKKQYPVFASNNSPTDKLYRVQVGPFGDVKEAEAARARLVSDGYNPILKK
jgi:cell division septation protein DedD